MTSTADRVVMTDLEAAQVAHELIRTYQRAIGDPVSPPWDEAPDWDRESMLAGVTAARDGAGPEQMHERWRAARTGLGWQPGPIKSTERQVHPNLVPYAELPEAQRRKNLIVLAVAGPVG